MTSEASPSTGPSENATEVKSLRLHVGGLPGKISEKDVEERFRSFGKVEKVDLIPHPFEENTCRGFAYVNLITTDAQLSKCMNLLNGCAWKGGRLHISQAKPNRFERLEDGRVVILKPAEEGVADRRMKKKKKRKLVRHSGDQSLVNDKNVDKRKGWRRGRYGRAITCLRIRRPNRQMLIIDPSHYKNNLEKLFGSIRPKPLSQLTWTITDISEEDITSKEGSEAELEEIVEKEEEEEEIFEDALENSSIYEDISMEVDQQDSDEVKPESKSESEQSKIDSFSPSDAFDTSKTMEYVEASDNLVSDIKESSTLDANMEPLETKELSKNTESPSENQELSPIAVPVSAPTSQPAPVNFEVNVNWSSLFSSQPATTTTTATSASLFSSTVSDSSNATGFSLNSLLFDSKSAAKIKNVSVDELFKKQPEVPVVAKESKEEPVKSSESVEERQPVKKIHNYASLFGDLNRITPTTATRFGMLLSQKEDLLQEWRIERIELKDDFKKKLAEGKRRNRKHRNVSSNQ